MVESTTRFAASETTSFRWSTTASPDSRQFLPSWIGSSAAQHSAVTDAVSCTRPIVIIAITTVRLSIRPSVHTSVTFTAPTPAGGQGGLPPIEKLAPWATAWEDLLPVLCMYTLLERSYSRKHETNYFSAAI